MVVVAVVAVVQEELHHSERFCLQQAVLGALLRAALAAQASEGKLIMSVVLAAVLRGLAITSAAVAVAVPLLRWVTEARVETVLGSRLPHLQGAVVVAVFLVVPGVAAVALVEQAAARSGMVLMF